MPQPTWSQAGLYQALLERGISRRTFLKFCTAIAGVLALPAAFAPRIADALETAPRIPLVWLHGQACGGETGAFLRSASPTTSELILSLLSVDYQEMLMAASGETATRALTAITSSGSGYLAVVEGAIPLEADGMYCLVGGRPFVEVARVVTRGAAATIAVGACAVDGGVSAAHNGVSGAVGVGDLDLGSRLVNLPGCPVNVANLAATVVYYLTFHELPPMGSGRRPLFAYGGLIHNQCERRAHFEFGEFATEWGDAGAQQGWCLYKLGCKGPESFANCPTKRYAEGTSWPVLAGHGCVGCTMPRFWDTMLPAYRRLPSPIPFAPTITADQVGGALVGGVAALTAVHGAASFARARLSRGGAAQSSVPIDPADEAIEPSAPQVALATDAGSEVQAELAALPEPPRVAPGVAVDDEVAEEVRSGRGEDAAEEVAMEPAEDVADLHGEEPVQAGAEGPSSEPPSVTPDAPVAGAAESAPDPGDERSSDS